MFINQSSLHRLLSVIVLGALLLGGNFSSAAEDALAPLEAQHQELVAAYQAAAPHGVDLHLRLPAAVDRELVELVLRRRGSEWVTLSASVPAWQGTSFREFFKFHERHHLSARDRHGFTASAENLAWNGETLQGALDVAFRLDRLRHELLPPGAASHLTHEGFWSPIDRYDQPLHRQPRPQRIELELAADGRHSVRLELPEIFGGTVIEGWLPPRLGERIQPLTSRMNVGFHHADLSGLALRSEGLSGELHLTINPDVMAVSNPRNARPPQPVSLRLALDGQRSTGGELTGSWTLIGEASDWVPASGSISGWARPALSGHYRSSGALGSAQGRAWGWLEPVPDEATAALPALPENPLARAQALLDQLRALRRSTSDTGPHLAKALAASSLPALRWDGQSADFAAYARRLVSLGQQIMAADEPLPERLSTVRFGGFSQPLPGPLAAEAAGTGWWHPPQWQVLGPMPYQLAELPADAAELLPEPRAVYALSEAFSADASASELRWTAVAADGQGRVQPPAWSTRGRQPPPGWPLWSWYASTRLELSAPLEVHLAIAGESRVEALWLDGRLLYREEEADPRLRHHRTAVIPVHLSTGSRELVLRLRQDESATWAGLWLRSAAAPAHAPLAQPMAAATQSRVALPTSAELSSGHGVAWRRPLPGLIAHRNNASAEGPLIQSNNRIPLAAGQGRVFAGLHPYGLAAVDLETGELAWQAEINVLELVAPEALPAWQAAGDDQQRAAVLTQHQADIGREITGRRGSQAPLPGSGTVPVWNHDRVLLHVETGVTAAFAADGRRLWLVRDHIASNCQPLVHGDLIYLVGTPLATWDGPAVEPGGSAVVALDRASGAVRWQRAVAGGGPRRLLALDPPGGAVLITMGGSVLDAADGRILAEGLSGPSPWDWAGALIDGQGGVVMAHSNGQGRMEMWREGDGGLGYHFSWLGQRFNANLVARELPAAVDQRSLLVVGRPREYSKHDPAYSLILNRYALSDGSPLGEIRLLLRGSSVPALPVVAGDLLYISDHRGGSHTGAADGSGRQLTVVDLSADQPLVVGRITVGDLLGAPLVVGDRVLLCRAGEVLCLRREDPARDDRERAATILGELMPPPLPAQLTLIPADPEPATGLVPALVDPDEHHQAAPASAFTWLQAGPFPAAASVELPAALAGAAKLPLPGSSLALAGQILSVAPLEAARWRQYTRWSQWNRLDKWYFRGDGLQIDLSGLAGEDEVLWLWTAIEVPRQRALLPVFDRELFQAWIGGMPVRDGRAIALEAGVHLVALRAAPAVLEQRRPLGPIDLAAAAAAGLVQALPWPEDWQLYGPLASTARQPSASTLGAAVVDTGDQELAATALRAVDGILDLNHLERPGSASVWLSSSIDIPADGKLLINASADWSMAWYVDGRRVYSTIGRGNGGSHEDVARHSFAVPVAAGARQLAVQVQPGSKGWSLRARAAFTTTDPHAVAAAHPHPRGHRESNDTWTSVGFAHADLPADQQQAWRRELTPWRAQLQWIIDTLPGSEEAERANGYLQAVTAE